MRQCYVCVFIPDQAVFQLLLQQDQACTDEGCLCQLRFQILCKPFCLKLTGWCVRACACVWVRVCACAIVRAGLQVDAGHFAYGAQVHLFLVLINI